jgi:NAD(P)-dependent dehydrogenase (short-subunit alcohol dehydrogenase family)
LPDPLFAVDGRVVVLTGACGLIGKTLAKSLRERGARLALVDLEVARPQDVAEAIGGGAIGLKCDVSRSAEVAGLVTVVQERFGRVDILINNHQHKPMGFTSAQPETFPEELWDAILDVNLKGTFLTCRDFGQVMLQQGRGNIINIASTYGVVSSNPSLYQGNTLGNPVAYSASKGGVIMLSKYLGSYWASRGVRVNCVTPHGVWNDHEPAFVERFCDKSPMHRMMTADEVVGAVLFLASEASSYATGSNLLIEGGWTAW